MSAAAIRRAERETSSQGLKVKFHVADMRNLSALPESDFDVVLAGDNSLPHLLSDNDLRQALKNLAALLCPKRVLVATIRDYDNLLRTRPAFQGPTFYSENGRRRIVSSGLGLARERIHAASPPPFRVNNLAALERRVYSPLFFSIYQIRLNLKYLSRPAVVPILFPAI